MGIPEDLYFALIEVGICARRCKIPGSLAKVMFETAHDLLDICRQDEKTATIFASHVLSCKTNLWTTTGQLPEPVASACFKLLKLLGYLASLEPRDNGPPPGGKAGEDLLQPQGLLEGSLGH